jgi:hypothetical protein
LSLSRGWRITTWLVKHGEDHRAELYLIELVKRLRLVSATEPHPVEEAMSPPGAGGGIRARGGRRPQHAAGHGRVEDPFAG